MPPAHMSLSPLQRSRLNGQAYGTDYAATACPTSMSHGGSWPQDTPYGSGEYTSAGAPPPQPSPSPSPGLTAAAVHLRSTRISLPCSWRSTAWLLVVVFWGLVLLEFVVVETSG